MPMRILFLSNFYPPHELGGMGLRCQETLDRLSKRGHACHVLTSEYGVRGRPAPQGNVTRALYLQADLYHYRPLDILRRPWRERSNRHELCRVMQEFQPDVVFVWGMWNLSRTLAHLAEQRMPGRVAYAIASYWLIEPELHEVYWRQSPRRRWVEALFAPARWLVLRALTRERTAHPLALEQVACVSEYVRRKLGDADALPHGARVIYNGIDPQPFLATPVRQAPRNEEMQLIYTGGILAQKGVYTAVEAMGLLRQRGKAANLTLTVVGSGHPEYEAYLKERVSQLGLDASVTFCERVPREQIPGLLNDADVFLFTSVWEEPLARSVMEAMAAGLAVLATPVGGQSEMLENEVNALIFPPGDAEALASCIQRVRDDPNLRVRLGKAGRETVLERFTLERMVDSIEAWLEAIIRQDLKSPCEIG